MAFALAGCEGGFDLPALPGQAAPEEATVENPAIETLPEPETAPAETDPGAAPLDDTEQQIARAAAEAPHIYMAIQPDGSRPISVIFAIDESRDNTPSNDPAIRLTPEAGDCNPQPLQRFDFPPPYGEAPVFSGDQILRGIPGERLPEFMAVAVTDEIVSRGLVTDREDTWPHNVCTRKFWEAQLANPAGQS